MEVGGPWFTRGFGFHSPSNDRIAGIVANQSVAPVASECNVIPKFTG